MLWRYTMLYPQFLNVDARITYIILALCLHMSVFILELLGVCFVFLFIIARRGLSVAGAFRAIRAYLASDYRPAVPPFQRRWSLK